MRRLALASALLSALLLAPLPARAVPGRAGSPLPPFSPVELAAPPSVVRAGEVVTLRWSVRGESPEELELLLSLDDGRTFPLRVSPQLDGHERVYRWRVPDVVASAARLRVRSGDANGESEGPMSAAFRIEPDEDARPRQTASELVHEGGWWDDLHRPLAGHDAGLAGGHETTLAEGALPPAASHERRAPRDLPAPHADETGVLTSSTLVRTVLTPARRTDARPERIPLRN